MNRPTRMTLRTIAAIAAPSLFVAGVIIARLANDQVAVAAVARSFMVAVASAFIVTLLLWAVVRDAGLASLIAVALGVGILFRVPIGLLLLCAGAVVAYSIVRARWGRPVRVSRAPTALFALGMALVLVGLGSWASGGGIGLLARDIAEVELTPPASADLPSIYVVLLDGYPNPATLRGQFSVADGGLESRLAKYGFDSYPASRSNYGSTALTLASLFNASYIQDTKSLRAAILGDEPMQPTFRDATNDGLALGMLRAAGYQITAVSAGWEELALRRADRFIDAGQINEVELVLLESTSIKDVLESVAPDFLGGQLRGRVTQNLANLALLAGAEPTAPAFVFVHVPSPHYPIIFGVGGAPVDTRFADLYRWVPPGREHDLIAQYRAQVGSLDQLVEDAVAQVVRGDPDAVVIVMSDHGSLTDVGPAEERVSNLLLARTPRHPGLFGDLPSPVQLVPRLLNAYAGTTYDVPSTRSYLSSPDNELEFTEVPVPID